MTCNLSDDHHLYKQSIVCVCEPSQHGRSICGSNTFFRSYSEFQNDSYFKVNCSVYFEPLTRSVLHRFYTTVFKIPIIDRSEFKTKFAKMEKEIMKRSSKEPCKNDRKAYLQKVMLARFSVSNFINQKRAKITQNYC